MAGSSTTKASNPSQRGSSASVAPRRATAPASETLAQRQAALQAALQAPNPFARGLSIQARDGGAAVHGGNDEQQAAARTKRTCLGSAQDEGISRAGDARPMPTAAQQAKLRQEVLGMTPTEQARAYAGDDASSTGAFAKERETSPLQLEREMHASAAAEVQAMGSLAGAGQLPGVPPSISAAFAKDSLEVVISQAVVESMQAVAGNISRNAASEQKPPALEDLPHGAADGAGTTTSLPADVDQARSQSSHPKRQRRQLYVPPAAQDEAAVQALKAAMRRPVAPREK